MFASFEPGGLVSVDKPPLSLWVQTISAKVFGFNQMSLLVPQAIARVLVRLPGGDARVVAHSRYSRCVLPCCDTDPCHGQSLQQPRRRAGLCDVGSRVRRDPCRHERSIPLAGVRQRRGRPGKLLWTQSSLANGVTPQLSYAQATGLSGARSGLQPNGGFTFPTGDQKRLVGYLRSHHTTEKWLVAVQSAAQAESIIISSGEPVMTMGGFIGSDPILTEDQLRAKIAAGQVRYFVVSAGGFGRGGFGPGGFGPGGFGPGGLGGAASSFVSSECPEVPSSAWQSGGDDVGETSFAGGPTSASFTLYDCRPA